MKHKKTIAELRFTCNSKAPIDDTVVKRWNDIVDSLANRWPLATIAETLRAEGEHVGNDKNTGFTTAVNRVAKRKGVNLDLVKAGDPAAIAKAVIPDTEPDSPAPRVSSLSATNSGGMVPSSSANDGAPAEPLDAVSPGRNDAAPSTKQSLADTRFPSDF